MKHIQLILGNITFHGFTEEELSLFKGDTKQKALIHEIEDIKYFNNIEDALKEAENTHHMSWIMPIEFKGEIVVSLIN